MVGLVASYSKHCNLTELMITLKINGKIIKGRGSAATALRMQHPYFLHLLPELTSYYLATLNVELEEALYVTAWDFETQPIYWFEPNPSFKEKFSFMRVRLIYNGDLTINAVLYHPDKSPHRENPYVIELIAPYLQLESDLCQIVFNRISQKKIINLI